MTYLHGVNYPWSADGTTVYYGLDFGANVWGSHLGVSTRRDAVTRDFSRMAGLGFTVARWFLFGDGRAGILYDDRGFPASTDAHLFVDLDVALEIARDAGIRIDFVLLDHRWLFDGVRQTIADPVTGALLEGRLPAGRADVLLSKAGRDALFDRVIVPLVRRYGHTGERADLKEQILAFEFMNEPDFVIDEWEQDLSSHVSRPLPFAVLAESIGRLSEVVHHYSSALTTLGGARAHNLWAWDDDELGLDVLQVHSYSDPRHPDIDIDLFGIPVRQLDVKRRVIIGEFPGNAPVENPPKNPRSLDDYLEFAVREGYAGGWPWSFSGTDVYGTLPVEPLMRFAARHPDLVNPRLQRQLAS